MRRLLYLFIFLVSLYDCYWCYVIPIDRFILIEECNPIVSYLVSCIGISWFIVLKLFLTISVIYTSEILYQLKYKYWKLTIGSLCFCQLLLLFYLELGHLYDVIDLRNHTILENLELLYVGIIRNYS